MSKGFHNSGSSWRERVRRFLGQAEKPLIVIVGPTAGGKTDFALDLASFIHESAAALRGGGKAGRGEIVNADSRQIYKRLTIGTAKIRREEMRGIPHHLLDERDPKEELTAAWFQKRATGVIDDILGRGNIPILAGGSMLYVRSVTDGLAFPDGADPALRRKLEEEYDKDRGASLYRRLETIDPETAAAFHRNNKPYVIRAMEIFASTGVIASAKKAASACPYDLLMLGIKRPREELAKRIDARTKILLARGWIGEVRNLLALGYAKEDPGMNSVGYREIIDFLEHPVPPEKLAEKISAKTRQYAKRQMTWWKRDGRILWIEPG